MSLETDALRRELLARIVKLEQQAEALHAENIALRGRVAAVEQELASGEERR